MAESVATKMEGVSQELAFLAEKLREFAELPEKEQRDARFDDEYVLQKMSDIGRLAEEVRKYYAECVPPLLPIQETAPAAERTPIRIKRSAACPGAPRRGLPQKKRLRFCTQALARALVDLREEDEKI